MAEPIYSKSVFAKYFASNDAEATAWADNVLAKLVAKGIVPNYVNRDGEGVESDFEVLYTPITLFYGYLVRLAREFRDFKDNSFLGDQYLNNKGQFTTGDETLDEILYLISNLLRVRAKRGTVKMLEKSATVGVPDGELLRLIGWNSLTFFKLGLARPQCNSWNMNNSSPLYRGCTGRYDLNIGYEYTEDVESLTPYPVTNPSYVSLATYLGKDCIEIEGVPVGQEAGIGLNDSSKRIVVTPELNYEITFYVAQDITAENITFGCLAFNAAGGAVNLKSIVTGANRNYFFETRRLNQNGKFYMVRGILYNKDQSSLSATNAKLNIGFGQHLKMPSDVVSIIPYIVMDNNAANDLDVQEDNFGSTSQDGDYDGTPSVYLWNLKVTPCSLEYERCFIGNKNFIDVLLNNQNGKYTDQQIIEILRKYFIPYNSSFKTMFYDIAEAVVEVGNFLLLESGDFILLENGVDKVLVEQQ